MVAKPDIDPADVKKFIEGVAKEAADGQGGKKKSLWHWLGVGIGLWATATVLFLIGRLAWATSAWLMEPWR